MQVSIGVSNRHIHLSENDAKTLFGKNYTFKKLKNISQPGQFALEETLDIKGPDNNNKKYKNIIKNIRILGPRRPETQIEIMSSDQYILGVNAKVKLSGDLDNTTGIILIGPKSTIKLNKGLIVAQRHLHISTKQANKYKLTNGQKISIKTFGDKAITFHNVIVRIEQDFKLDFHIDFDEANAGNIKQGDVGKITLS